MKHILAKMPQIVLAAGICLVLAGCASDVNDRDAASSSPQSEMPGTKVLEQEEPAVPQEVTPTTAANPADAQRVTPAAPPPVELTPTAVSPDIPTTDTAQETTDAEVAPEALDIAGTAPAAVAAITPQPSQFPQLMSRTVDLRNKIQQLGSGAQGVAPEVARELVQYSNDIDRLIKSDAQLSKEQRMEIEEHTGKLQHQSNQLLQQNDDVPVENRLRSIGNSLQKIHGKLADEPGVAQ